MTFRPDLNLDGMKEIIAWDDENFDDYTDHIPKKANLPYRYTISRRIYSPHDVYSLTTMVRRHCDIFFRKFLDRESNINPSIISEPLSNILEHAGDDAKKASTLIEHYHPSDPSKYIMRISNPHAREWDYLNMDKKGRGGYKTFSQWDRALVSYNNKGKDFLALITIH